MVVGKIEILSKMRFPKDWYLSTEITFRKPLGEVSNMQWQGTWGERVVGQFESSERGEIGKEGRDGSVFYKRGGWKTREEEEEQNREEKQKGAMMCHFLGAKKER
uniref:Uncharacterized protein n=1 Tax=Nelumbo nucifera TaxID=4432 RepID=A0A822YKR9_NELNU|nr:TPA_asm: hypothetical protein HUJ06_005414 [Nelumbo nucifera]